MVRFLMVLLTVFSLIPVAEFSNVYAQTSSIKGTVYDKTTGETLPGASVTIPGTSKGAATDLDGKFSIDNVEPGTYRVEVRFVSFNIKAVNDVVVVTGKPTVISVSLEPASTEIGTVVFEVKARSESIAAMDNIKKNNIQMSDGISGDVIRKTPDRNSGDVIKRVSGASIQDNKFAIIRGLNDRYNAAFLNGAPLPSSESDRKAFSFDIFPSALLDNIIILKTATPDLPADFAGGVININTRSIPEENMQAISIGTGYNTLATFKTFYTYDGGKYDFLGIDDGTRSLVDDLPETEEFRGLEPDKKAELAKLMPNDWALNETSASLPVNFQYSLSRVGKIKEHDFGSFVALTYNNNYSIRQSVRREYEEPVADEKPLQVFELTDDQYENAILGGLIWNTSYKLSPNSRLNLKNLYSINSSDKVVLRHSEKFTDGVEERGSVKQYTENKLYSGQLSGEHLLPEKKIKINWLGGYSNIERDIPNLRRMLYTRTLDGGPDSINPYVAAIPTSGTSPSAGGNKFYSNNKEQLYSGSYDITIPFKIASIETNIKVGGYHQARFRNFTSRQFGFSRYSFGSKIPFDKDLLNLSEDLIFAPENLGIIEPYIPAQNGNPQVKGLGGFKLEEATKLNDSYTASSSLHSGFAMFDNKFTPLLRLIWGVRMENYRQTLESFEDDGKEIKVDTTQMDFLPSANLIYAVTEKANLRLAYAQTLSRPEFRELAPFGFFDFVTFFTVRGNPDLKRALVHNYDARYEWFPGMGQMFSASVFYKKFIDAIEQVNRADVPRELYYQNVPVVNNYGVELEFRVNLGVIINDTATNFLNNLSVFSNLALIKSEVDVSLIPGSISDSRPLQGQSPYIINGGIMYNDLEKKFSVNLSYNKVGRRILIVGNTQEPDIYESPVDIVDFQISKTFLKNMNFKLNVSNLFAQSNISYQDIDGNKRYDFEFDNTMVETNNGRTISFGISYQF